MKKRYAVYATVYAKKDSKKIRLVHFLMIDADGKLIGEGSGDTTVRFYEGRIGINKIKKGVQSFAKYELERLGLNGEVSLEDIELKNSVEIEQIILKVKSRKYESLKDLR